MSSHRPQMSLRATSNPTASTTSTPSTSNATTPSTNPGSPLSPSSSKDSSTFSFFSSRNQSRSQTLPTGTSFFRSRSRSPRPPPTELKHAATSPVTASDHHSHSASHQHRSSMPSPPPSSPASPRTDSGFFQKKPRQSSSYGYATGRHGNDWLFGNVSITETVKHHVGGGKRKDSGGSK